MSLLVVGSIAIDSVETPSGKADEALGGSAAYFSYAASYFCPVRLVGVIGEDFPDDYLSVLKNRENIDVSGVQVQPGKTFRWRGKYEGDMNVAETLEVQLNVFGSFDPDIPETFRDSPYVFLANGSPEVQRKVLHQVRKPKLVFADTMNLWIEIKRPELLELLKQVDGLILNDQEALMLTEADTLVKAGRAILGLGPKYVVVKKGEHGAMFFSNEGIYALPAFPTAHLVDPTGAGDSFAGGVMGYLTHANTIDSETIKRAMAYGSVIASINVEGFSLGRFRETTRQDIEQRFALYRDMLRLG
ncbi:sugar kinase [bacterium]|jgi:sugar/nucleoside kinase (ribokinase family)|nr:sugar kinase [bacterium]